ncbi:MAG: ABC transporter substrate-binding protein [Anaerolineales bacterium]|nr:ABC transporter substrate-binding protein [Anaerolineales bacterium]
MSDTILLEVTSVPERVISLVPSTTETLVEFDLLEKIVGITDFCLPDDGRVTGIPRLGGTKNPDIDQIFNTKPDIVIVNREENSREVVETLDDAGLNLWLSFPKSVNDAILDLWTMARLFHVEDRHAPRLETLEKTLQWTTQAAMSQASLVYFCPIWQNEEPQWWMTFNGDTYSSDLLAHCGGENAFATRNRRYPLAADLGLEPAQDAGDRDIRYPRLTAKEIIDAQPEVLMLPSEPFGFGEEDAENLKRIFAETPAVKEGKVFLIDGSLITWHGIRMARALAELPQYFQHALK